MMIFLLFIYQFIIMATKPISISSTSKTLNGGMTDSRVALQYVDSMSENSKLKVTETLLSNNGLYELEFLANGNLVLYRTSDRFALWSTNTAGSGAVQAMMKGGNLVLYTAGTISGGRSSTTLNHLVSHSSSQKQQSATEVFQNDTASDYELTGRINENKCLKNCFMDVKIKTGNFTRPLFLFMTN